MCNKTLGELQLRDEGIMMLGIQRDKDTYLGVPQGDATITADDILIAHGRNKALEALNERRRRRKGEREHRKAKAKQEKIVEQQADEDNKSRQKTE